MQIYEILYFLHLTFVFYFDAFNYFYDITIYVPFIYKYEFENEKHVNARKIFCWWKLFVEFSERKLLNLNYFGEQFNVPSSERDVSATGRQRDTGEIGVRGREGGERKT